MKKRKIKYNETDFISGMLPKNRKDQFFDIVKLEWKTLIYIGLLLLLFFIPEIILIFFKNSYLIGLKNNVQNNEYETLKLLPDLLSNIAEIFGLGIFCIGLSGAMRILRHLVWGEQVYFWNDFGNGIKNNFKRFFEITLLIIVIKITNTLITFYICSITNSPVDSILCAIIDFIDLFLLLPIALFMFSYSNIYIEKFKKTIINCSALSIKSYVKSVWFVLVPLSFYFIFNIPSILFTIIVTVLTFVLIVPTALLAMYLLHTSYFDLLINKNFAEIYKKGLANE